MSHRLDRKTADRLGYAIYLGSIYLVLLAVAGSLATIVMVAANRYGFPGLLVGVAVGIPASILVGELVSLVTSPVVEGLLWVIQSWSRAKPKEGQGRTSHDRAA